MAEYHYRRHNLLNVTYTRFPTAPIPPLFLPIYSLPDIFWGRYIHYIHIDIFFSIFKPTWIPLSIYYTYISTYIIQYSTEHLSTYLYVLNWARCFHEKFIANFPSLFKAGLIAYASSINISTIYNFIYMPTKTAIYKLSPLKLLTRIWINLASKVGFERVWMKTSTQHSDIYNNTVYCAHTSARHHT